MAASSSFLMGTPVKADELTQTEVTMMKSEGYIKGLDTAVLTTNTVQDTTIEKDGIMSSSSATYYLSSFNQEEKGRHVIDGNTYYFNEKGEIQTGFIEENGKTYFYGEDGALAKGTVEYEGKTYSLQNDGSLKTGWSETDGNKEYYSEQGVKAKNEIKVIDGNRYSFDGNGVMEVNVTRDIYDFDENGIGKKGKAAYQKIADAALDQIGVTQDCTMLVTNSLKAVGINFHGAPEQYLSLGPTTDDPVPGDIIVYSGHVALYIGD